jgi:phenylpropionate dioxygenase-like ring-hydroxylating dioxygenase large terminal subunit
MSFLTNTWYMAAWAEEVGASLLRRKIISLPVVLYRLESGRVAALEDRCPHRFAPLSRGTRQREEGVIVKQAHVLTPETEQTSHYFWSTTRTTVTTTPEGDAMLRALMTQAFDVEDKPMIEAAYHNLDGEDFWARKPVFLGIDAGGARARHRLQRLKAAERTQGSA